MSVTRIYRYDYCEVNAFFMYFHKSFNVKIENVSYT